MREAFATSCKGSKGIKPLTYAESPCRVPPFNRAMSIVGLVPSGGSRLYTCLHALSDPADARAAPPLPKRPEYKT